MSTDFSKVFSQLRRDRGLSQRQVASDLDISQALLSHYENGLREPRIEFIMKIFDYYGVSADYLFGRTKMRNDVSAYMSGFDERDAESLEYMFELVSTIGRILKESEDRAKKEPVIKYLEFSLLKVFLCLGAYDRDRIIQYGVREEILDKMCAAAQMRFEAAMIENRVPDEHFASGEDGSLGAAYNLLTRLKPEIEEELLRLKGTVPEGGKI